MKKFTENGFQTSAIILGFLGTLMIFFTALIFESSDTSFTGLQVAFGHEFANLGPWASGEIQFNPILLIAYLLPLFASLCLLFIKKGYIIATVLFTLSAILLFLSPEYTTVNVTVLGIVNEIDVNWTFGIGLILSASVSILGVMVGLARIFEKK